MSERLINRIQQLNGCLQSLIKCIVMMAVILIMMILAEFVVCSDYGAAGIEHSHNVSSYGRQGTGVRAWSHITWVSGRRYRIYSAFMVIPIHFTMEKEECRLNIFLCILSGTFTFAFIVNSRSKIFSFNKLTCPLTRV